MEAVLALERIVQERRRQVVGNADGMDVAGEVEVEILHGHHLAVASTSGATLDAEYRSQGGLPDADYGILAYGAQRLSEADGGDGLALAQRGGGDSCDVNILGLGLVGKPAKYLQLDLGLVIAVELYLVSQDADSSSHLFHLTQFSLLCNFQVT